jgi:uncharacterized membrane protein
MANRKRRGRGLVPAVQEARRPTLNQIIQFSQQSFSGPLPAPEHLREYEEIVPGLANRLVVAWEKQSDHRQGLETTVVHGNVRAQTRGAYLGFIIALVLVSAGVWLIRDGFVVPGTTIATTTAVSLAGVFVYGRREQRSEREAKRQELVR